MYNLQPSDINRRNVSFGLLRVYKDFYQRASLKPYSGPKTIGFIMGCQRSGTSLTYWIFERDFNAKIYRESSSLSSKDTVEKLRLDPLPEVQSTFDKHAVPLIVAKPLVESQRALELLDRFPEAKILWLYRHYQDVASSNLKAFGMDNGVRDLRPILAREQGNWRAENVSDETVATLKRFFAEEMNPYDAAALFWYARNRLFFEQRLDSNPRVMLCRYENLVTDPTAFMRNVYAFLGVPYPGDQITQDVHPQSVGKGRKSKLTPEVDALCAELLTELDDCYERSPAASPA